jgi:adenylate cyclase
MGQAGAMAQDPLTPDADDPACLGPRDPDTQDAADQRELVRYALAMGASLEDVTSAPNLGELLVDLTLRPRGPLPLREVVASAGIDWPTALRLMTAAGLPTDPEFPVTADESASIRLFAGAHNNLLGEEATLQLARVTGSTMARLAETLVGVFRLRVELPRRAAGSAYVDIVKEYADLTETVLPDFVATLDAVLRRQIVAVAERMWSTDPERSVVTVQRTVGFVDLVGYTTATASLSLRQLTDVLVEFDQRTSEIVAQGNGQIVKTIGDEAMFVTEDAGDACRIALDLIEADGGTLPAVRVGLATGEMASVFGDLYGPDVNLASRLVGVAEPSTAVVSDRVHAAASGFHFDRLPPLTLKGIAEPTTAYRMQRSLP